MHKVNILSLLLFGLVFGQSSPGPPAIPEIQAVSGNEKILLMWDNVAESSKDPLTGYSDFEGYRIYRSSDGGMTWGDFEDRMFDFTGNFVGWKPYAQFDLVEESDSLHCIYSNGYLGESGELCYSLGYEYDEVPSALLSSSNVIIDEDSLVYLPKYIRGTCPSSQEHVSHLPSVVHTGFDDCYSAGYLDDFDPMASWINLGKNDSLKRTFVDTDVLDGVEYTYAVSAFDTGLKTFQVNYINIDANAESGDNYCDGEDSYCNGSDFYCDGDGSFCSDYDSSIWGIQTDEQNCTGGFVGGTWNVVEYTDSTSCVNQGICNENIDSHVTKTLCDNENGGNDVHSSNPGTDHWNEYGWNETTYSIKSTCESANYEWIIVEYFDQASCEAVDNDNDGISDHEWKIIYFIPDTTWSSWNPGHHLGLDYSFTDHLWGYPSFESPKTYEPFTDYNSNGICDNESFIDLDSSDGNQNGICDQAGDWSSRCPDDVNDCRNVIVVTPGYKASNITFPSDNPEIEFIVPDSLNKGNGTRKYNIVNEYDLTDAILRFEINAALDPQSFGDSLGSFATLDPSLYIYEAISSENLNPLNLGVTYIVDGMSESMLDSLLGLPGANYSSDETEVVLPEYKLENFKLTYIDDPLFDSHFTNWFDGIQFRFDNGPNKINDVLSLVEIKEITFSDTLYLKNVISIKMKYNAASDISKRPMYRYRIDFSTSSVLDTATYGTGRDCDQYTGYPNNSHTFLPFRITNITNGEFVTLSHVDNGVQSGGVEYDEITGGCTAACNSSDLICVEGTCVDKTGDRDCSWQRNEILQMTDVVFSDEHTDGIEDILFDMKIDFNYMAYVFKHVPNFFEISSTTGMDWVSNQSYNIYDIVLYDGMLFEAQSVMPDSTIPTYWFDDDGDDINDNPWKMLYPWEDGDYMIIEPYGWYQDGDAWVADLSDIGSLDEDDSDDLNEISVVPNPYIVNSNYFNESPGNNLLRFTRLPNICTISIYTITGEFVTTINHDDPFDGNEFWDLKNGKNQEIAPGLYIYVIKTDHIIKIDKFAVVR